MTMRALCAVVAVVLAAVAQVQARPSADPCPETLPGALTATRRVRDVSLRGKIINEVDQMRLFELINRIDVSRCFAKWACDIMARNEDELADEEKQLAALFTDDKYDAEKEPPESPRFVYFAAASRGRKFKGDRQACEISSCQAQPELMLQLLRKTQLLEQLAGGDGGASERRREFLTSSDPHTALFVDAEPETVVFEVVDAQAEDERGALGEDSDTEEMLDQLAGGDGGAADAPERHRDFLTKSEPSTVVLVDTEPSTVIFEVIEGHVEDEPETPEEEDSSKEKVMEAEEEMKKEQTSASEGVEKISGTTVSAVAKEAEEDKKENLMIEGRKQEKDKSGAKRDMTEAVAETMKVEDDGEDNKEQSGKMKTEPVVKAEDTTHEEANSHESTPKRSTTKGAIEGSGSSQIAESDSKVEDAREGKADSGAAKNAAAREDV